MTSRGRPTRAKKESAARVELRLTDTEKRAAKKKARAAGYKRANGDADLSAWIRALMFQL